MSNSRPQNKNLIPLTERSPEEAHAIRSAGGKAVQEQRRKKQQLADLLTLYADLPIKDARVRKRLKNLGIPEEELTQRMHIADAVMKAAQKGNIYAVDLFREITGEGGAVKQENNLLDAIKKSIEEQGGLNTDDIPEIQQTANAGNDLVDAGEI